MNNNKSVYFSEILTSSLTIAQAQCWKSESCPPFGSLILIKNQEHDLVGIISDITTGSFDPVRQPFAYQKTDAELKRDHPEIFMFIQTTITVALLGSLDSHMNIRHTVPPKPAKLHSFVQLAPPEFFCQFFKNPQFLPMLFTVHRNLPLRDELLLSILQQLAHFTLLTPEFLHEMSQQLSLLAGTDYKQLKIFLQRLEQLMIL